MSYETQVLFGLESVIPSHAWLLCEGYHTMKRICLASALFLVTGLASAHESCKWEDVTLHIGKYTIQIPEYECSKRHKFIPVAAPEVDPAGAIAGLTLMAGALAIIRGRRRQVLKA